MTSAAALTRELVGIDSTNRALGGPGTAAAAAFCAEVLTAAGFAVADRHGCLVADRPGAGSVLLVGHLDTYGWWGPVRERDGILAGPGTMDMKAGVAMILAAAPRLPGGVTVVLTPDEESDSAALRALAPTLTADVAVVTESTGLQLGTRHDGSVTATLTGPPPALPGLRAAYARRGDRVRVRVPVRAGERAYAVADRLRAACGDRLTHLDVRESFRADGVDLLAAALTAAAAGRGRRVRPVPLDGWTEAAVLSTRGIPTLVFGPRGWGAHTPAERVVVRDIDLGTDLLLEALDGVPDAPDLLAEART